MTGNERHIIISVDLEAHPSEINLDLGNIAPHIAFAVLSQALDALDMMGASVKVVHNGHLIATDIPEELL
jgi:hypothetical protein